MIYSYFLRLIFFFAIYFSTSSFQLILDGGARAEGVQLFVQNSGALGFVKPLWLLAAAFITVRHIFYVRRFRFSGFEKWLFFLAIYFCVGLIWSDNVFMAVKIVAAMLVSIFTVSEFVFRFGFRNSIVFAGNSLLVILCASILAPLLFTSYGLSIGVHEGAWQGVFTHKNDLGSFCILSICFFLGFFEVLKKTTCVIGVLVAVFLSFMSTSTTSLVGVASILFVFFVLSILPRVVDFLYAFRVYLVFGVLLLSVIPVVFHYSSFDINVLGKGAGFTGRGVIWEYFLSKFISSPFFGYGFNQFNAEANFTTHAAYRVLGFTPGSAHNGVLDSLLSLGVVGFFLFCRVLYFFSKTDKKNFCAGLIFLTGFSVVNGMEAQMVYFNPWFVFFVFYLSLFLGSWRGYAAKSH